MVAEVLVGTRDLSVETERSKYIVFDYLSSMRHTQGTQLR